MAIKLDLPLHSRPIHTKEDLSKLTASQILELLKDWKPLPPPPVNIIQIRKKIKLKLKK
jgi:hypothetical protein